MCLLRFLLMVTLLAAAAVGQTAPAGPGKSVEASAAEKFASLNRAILSMTDLDQIIQRYERFVVANPNTDAAAEAQRQADIWRERKSLGMVKVGSRWVTPAEREALAQSMGARIADARQLLSTGQVRDAAAIIDKVLELEPGNISGLYLQGLVHYAEEDRLPAARKSFEAVNAQISAHAPTLNNLAVVNLRQNQVPAAMSLFDQAMLAAPADRIIIDNVAEALNALKEGDRRGTAVLRTQRRFTEQESALIPVMREQGLYRWGSTWVEKPQYTQLVAAEQEVQRKIRQYQVDSELLAAQIATLEGQIDDSERELRRIRDDSYFFSTTGQLIQRPLPSYYYDEQRRRDRLIAERAQAIAQRNALREQAERVVQDLPVPKFSGVFRLIGEEGTPVEAPATQPASTEPARK